MPTLTIKHQAISQPLVLRLMAKKDVKAVSNWCTANLADMATDIKMKEDLNGDYVMSMMNYIKKDNKAELEASFDMEINGRPIHQILADTCVNDDCTLFLVNIRNCLECFQQREELKVTGELDTQTVLRMTEYMEEKEL